MTNHSTYNHYIDLNGILKAWNSLCSMWKQHQFVVKISSLHGFLLCILKSLFYVHALASPNIGISGLGTYQLTHLIFES